MEAKNEPAHAAMNTLPENLRRPGQLVLTSIPCTPTWEETGLPTASGRALLAG